MSPDLPYAYIIPDRGTLACRIVLGIDFLYPGQRQKVSSRLCEFGSVSEIYI